MKRATSIIIVENSEFEIDYTFEEPDYLTGDSGYIHIQKIIHNGSEMSENLFNQSALDAMADEVRKELSW